MKATVGNQARPSAFSLVELLVVMGIIALLIGILLPALAESREEARNMICTTHLDQIFKASYMYASANEERLPRFGWAPSGDPTVQEWWPTQIAALLNGETETYRCPSDADPSQEFEVVRKPGGTIIASEGGIEPGRFALDITYRGSCDMQVDKGGYYFGRRITDFDSPSIALTLIEATVQSEPQACFRFSGGLTMIGTEQWYASTEWVHTWERHVGTSNLLFLDGGVGRYRPHQMPAIALQQEYWGSGPDKKTDGVKRNPGA